MFTKVVLVFWWLLTIRVLMFRLHYTYRTWQAKKIRKGYGSGFTPILRNSYKEYAPAFSTMPVTLQIVSFNEGELLIKCIKQCALLWYPCLEIQVLDNSTDGSQTFTKQFCEDLQSFCKHKITYIENANHGFKSGALYVGLSSAIGDYIAILDVDFLPGQMWLANMMKHFVHHKHVEDSRYCKYRLGMVQGRWDYFNKHKNTITRAADALMTSYFRIEKFVETMKGGFSIFNGSGAVFRKDCIVDAGGWDPDVVLSLDVELSQRIKETLIWGTLYVDDDSNKTTGLVPETWSAYIKQQARWCKSGSYLTASQPFTIHTQYLTWTTIKLAQYVLLWLCFFAYDPILVGFSLLAAIPNLVEAPYFISAVGWRGWFAAVRGGIFSLHAEAIEVFRSVVLRRKPKTFPKTPKSKSDVALSAATLGLKDYFNSVRCEIDVLFFCMIYAVHYKSNEWLFPTIVISLVLGIYKVAAI